MLYCWLVCWFMFLSTTTLASKRSAWIIPLLYRKNHQSCSGWHCSLSFYKQRQSIQQHCHPTRPYEHHSILLKRAMSTTTTSNDDVGTSRSNRNLVVIISGPTGVGKSDVAALLCKKHSGMVVSADSVQAHHGVQIGANKPTAQEMEETPHLLVNVVSSSDEQYNAAEWRRDAIYSIQQLLNDNKNSSVVTTEEAISGKQEEERRVLIAKTIREARLAKGYNHEKPILPVVVGGTVMYLQWLVHGQPDVMRPSEDAVAKARDKMLGFQKNNDWDGAVLFVASMGPTFASRIETTLSGQDWYRLRRILEVAYTVALDQKHDMDELMRNLYSGEREGVLQEMMDCDVRCFFLCPHDRMSHTTVVDGRCEDMVMRGLIQETADLYLSKSLPDMAARAIGYRQTLDYLLRKNFEPNDATALEAYLHDFATATRRYATKQMKWFRKDNKFIFCPVLLSDSKESRVQHAADTIWNMCQLPRQDYEKELVEDGSLSVRTKRANEAQGKGMKFYQFQSQTLKPGTSEFQLVLQQADECTRRMRQVAVEKQS